MSREQEAEATSHGSPEFSIDWLRELLNNFRMALCPGGQGWPRGTSLDNNKFCHSVATIVEPGISCDLPQFIF